MKSNLLGIILILLGFALIFIATRGSTIAGLGVVIGMAIYFVGKFKGGKK